jgi:tripartite-type tricarboxylate transporter receptor subunit TctC
MRRVLAGLTALSVLLGAGGLAIAQDTDYPTRSIRVVVPYPAGGLVDLITRVVTER